MADRIPKSARFTIIVNDGIDLITGATIKKSISFGHLMPGSAAGSISAVAGAISGLLAKPTIDVTITEIDQLI